jgi:23S rRNA pseudouridine2605 synthase
MIQPQPQRINRILSLAGITSRRKADELIKAGRVMINGQVATEVGGKAVWGTDSIRVDGREIPLPDDRLYLMLNKPFGYISSLNDPAGRPIVSDLLKEVSQRVYPVGRLDFDSLGLLLLTNDGEWAYRLTHPRFRVPKTYKVTLDGVISHQALATLRKGVQLQDGFSGPAKVTAVGEDRGRSVVRLTLRLGRSRIVRRMMEAVGYQVIHLVRTGFGILELGGLKIGKYRNLEPDEVRDMKKLVGLD